MDEYYRYMSDYYNLLAFGFGYDKQDLFENAKGVKVIQFGNYDYSYFNFCFVNDMLTQILEVLSQGYIPRIRLANRENGWIDWSDYFEQPFFEYDQEYISQLPVTYLNERIETRWAGLRYEACLNEQEKALATRMYTDWMVINNRSFSYIQEEWKKLMQGKSVLGVLCRGTDMTGRKLQGHPIQPSVETVMLDAKQMMLQLNCEYIYLATEEKRIEDMFQQEFPGKIITNRRTYIDDTYYARCDGASKIFIEDIMKYDDEKYMQGLQYLSSIVLLSQCTGLLAGNCGGSEAALYMNEFGYREYKIYDLGLNT